MTNNFTTDLAAKLESSNWNTKLRRYKKNRVLTFKEIKSNEPKLTQKRISEQIGYLDSTIKRYRDDNNIDSPCIRKLYRQKKNKSNTSITQVKIHTTNENTKNDKKILEATEKNDLKGGSVLKNDHQEDNTKFLT